MIIVRAFPTGTKSKAQSPRSKVGTGNGTLQMAHGRGGQVPGVECKALRARIEACRACEHQVVMEFEERCGLRPEWGCLHLARQRVGASCDRWGE